MTKCSKCGRELGSEARFCDGCGLQLSQPPPSPTPVKTEILQGKPSVPKRRILGRTGLAALGILALVFVAAIASVRPLVLTQQVTSTSTAYVTTGRNQSITFTQVQAITVTRTVATTARDQLVEYCFTPGTNCTATVIKWIDQALKSVHVLIYTFNLDNINDALVRAKKRGIDVKVVMDAQQSTLLGSEYASLKKAGIDVRVDRTTGKMNDRLVIIDGSVVITGSFSWSTESSQQNRENLVVIRDATWAQAFEQHFRSVWDRATA